MIENKDEFQEQIDALGLYVDLGKLMPPNSHGRYYSIEKKQTMTLKSLDKTLQIQITLPDNRFEWFIDIMDNNGEEITSAWVDHYGQSDKELKEEMRLEIKEFIETVSKNKTRTVKRDENSNTFQYFDGQKWCDFSIF